jgi:hypothetical protein
VHVGPHAMGVRTIQMRGVRKLRTHWWHWHPAGGTGKRTAAAARAESLTLRSSAGCRAAHAAANAGLRKVVVAVDK